MAKRKCSKYSDDDILGFGNVPMTVAADYLMTCPSTLRAAMNKGLCPFGICAGTAYIIPSERLIKWKHGEDHMIVGNIRLIELIRDSILEIEEKMLRSGRNATEQGAEVSKPDNSDAVILSRQYGGCQTWD